MGVVRLELIRPVNHPNIIVMVRETIDSSVVLNQIYKGLNKANPIKYLFFSVIESPLFKSLS